MPDVKFTLSANQQDALKKVREVDGGFLSLEANALRAGRAVDAVMAKLSRGVQFHGGRSLKNVASELLGGLDERGVAALLAKHDASAGRVARQSGMRAEVQRLVARMQGDSSYAERAGFAEAMRLERLGGNKKALASDKGQIAKYIAREGLGDPSDPSTQLAARIVRQKMRNVERAMTEALVAERDASTTRAAQAYLRSEAQVSVRARDSEAAQSNLNRGIAERAATAQRIANRERIASVFEQGEAERRNRRIARRDQLRSERETAFEEAHSSAEAMAAEQKRRLAASRSKFRGLQWESQRVRSFLAGQDITVPDLIAGGQEGLPDRMSDEERKLIRSNRLAKLRELKSQRNRSVGSAIWSGVSGVAAVAASGIYFGEQVLGNYNERLGTQYFGTLAGIEPTFREVMGMSGNAGRQRQLRQQITDAAIANGRTVGETSSFFYDIFSAAGNLSEQKQSQIIKTALRFQNVAGGDLPIIGQAMTTFENLYGPQVGSTDRMASIIKKAIDYGKFSPTGFAKLSPEAFSQASLRGIPMEEAAALMAVVSNRSGRDENMFTGTRYLFANMNKAADAGLVTRGGDFISQLRELKKASPAQLQSIYGMEGINVASNARDMIDDIEKLTREMRGLTGGELAGQQNALLRDPANAISRLAQSAATASDNILPSILQSGDPTALKTAGEAIRTRFAMAGQSALSPSIAALTDYTKNIDLEHNKDQYAAAGFQATQAALAAQGDAASRHQMQVNKLVMGKVQVGQGPDRYDTGGLGNEAGSPTLVRGAALMSSAADVQAYEQMVKDTGANDLTAEEFGQIRVYRDTNRGDEADALIARALARSKQVANASDTRPGGFLSLGRGAGRAFSAIGQTVAGFVPDSVKASLAGGAASLLGGMNPGKVRDAFNKAILTSSFSAAERDLDTAKAGGDPFAIDAARTKLRGMRDSRRKLAFDADGLTATDREALATEFTGGGSISDPATTMLKAAETMMQAVTMLVGGMTGPNAGRATVPGPTTSPSARTPATGRRPTTVPTLPANP